MRKADLPVPSSSVEGVQQAPLEGRVPATNVQPSAGFAHVDQDPSNGRRICESAGGADVFERNARVQTINLWRPLAGERSAALPGRELTSCASRPGPVRNSPLAAVDFRSLRPEDASIQKSPHGTAYDLHYSGERLFPPARSPRSLPPSSPQTARSSATSSTRCLTSSSSFGATTRCKEQMAERCTEDTWRRPCEERSSWGVKRCRGRAWRCDWWCCTRSWNRLLSSECKQCVHRPERLDEGLGEASEGIGEVRHRQHEQSPWRALALLPVLPIPKPATKRPGSSNERAGRPEAER